VKPKSKVKKPKQPSLGEKAMAEQLNDAGIAFEREFKFHAKRRWRADFRITGTQILVEVEGGVYSGGRHTRGTGYEADAEKYNAAAHDGWTVLRFTTGMVKNGNAIEVIKKTVSQINPMEQAK
jgi:very-short-patch-repair endonuclease